MHAQLSPQRDFTFRIIRRTNDRMARKLSCLNNAIFPTKHSIRRTLPNSSPKKNALHETEDLTNTAFIERPSINLVQARSKFKQILKYNEKMVLHLAYTEAHAEMKVAEDECGSLENPIDVPPPPLRHDSRLVLWNGFCLTDKSLDGLICPCLFEKQDDKVNSKLDSTTLNHHNYRSEALQWVISLL